MNMLVVEPPQPRSSTVHVMMVVTDVRNIFELLRQEKIQTTWSCMLYLYVSAIGISFAVGRTGATR